MRQKQSTFPCRKFILQLSRRFASKNADLFSRYMYRSFFTLKSDVICRGYFQKRMEANQSVRRKRTPGTRVPRLDAGKAGRTGRNCHAQSPKN
jgi:hypothetical protein